MMNGEQNELRNRKTAGSPSSVNDITNKLPDNNLAPAAHDYGSAAEYAEAVRAWLWAYHNWQLTQCLLPFTLHQFQVGASNQSSHLTSFHAAPSSAIVSQVPSAQPTQNGVQYTIPHFGRRIVAELIDGLFCFAISLLLTFIFVEMGLIDAEKYEKILNYEADLKVVINITQDLFPLEIIKRLLTSVIEAIFLSKGIGSIPAGQTPGKFVLSLKVIPCDEISFASARRGLVNAIWLPFEPTKVAVWPGPICETVRQNVKHFNDAFVRSVIKNFAMGFLFPLCVIMYTFRYNRAVYDLAAETVVVEA
uniref:RDD domain-containing protein n=1 Tax=Romanomermis culicivorax TaxID=13658 RepID=A0A915KL29_ROMCU